MSDEEIINMAEQAWEQFEFDNGSLITLENHDAMRRAFIYIYKINKEKIND